MAGPRVVKILKFSKSGNHRPQIKKVKVFGNQRVTPGGSIKRSKPRVTSIKKKVVRLRLEWRARAPGQHQHECGLQHEQRHAQQVQLAEAQRTLAGARCRQQGLTPK